MKAHLCGLKGSLDSVEEIKRIEENKKELKEMENRKMLEISLQN